MNEMTLRTARPADACAVETLLSRCYPALMGEAYAADVLAPVLPLITRANPALLASGTFYLVEMAGRAIGCGGWTFGAPGTGAVAEGLAHLRHFAVDPAHIRQGVGRLLYAACARAAAGQGAVRFQAYSSLNAETFYSGMGLKRLDVVSLVMTPDIAIPVVLMEGPVMPGR